MNTINQFYSLNCKIQNFVYLFYAFNTCVEDYPNFNVFM